MSKTQQVFTLLLFMFCGGLLLLGQGSFPLSDSTGEYAAGVIPALLLGLTAALGLCWKRPWLSLAVGAIVLAIVCGRGQDLFSLREPLTALWPFLLVLLARELTGRCVGLKWYRFGLFYGLYFLAAFGGGYLLVLHPSPWLCFEPIRAVWLILTADLALWSVRLGEDYAQQVCKLMDMAIPPGPAVQLQHRLYHLEFRRLRLRTARLVWTAAANLAALALILCHDRVQSILQDGLASWLSWRGSMLAANRTGDLAAAGKHFTRAVLFHCPLSRIRALNGPFSALLALALLCAVFLLMARILLEMPERRIYKPICRGLLLCLLAKTLLTLTADLFLIHSAQVQVPLLSSPWDLSLFSIFFILSSSPQERGFVVDIAEHSALR